MLKLYLDYLEWKAILFGETNLPQMEKELFDNISKLASSSSVTVILTENDKPVLVLKYDNESGRYSEHQIL
jgi:glucose-6-phosphate-specific signal transduction histidine kinase